MLGRVPGAASNRRHWRHWAPSPTCLRAGIGGMPTGPVGSTGSQAPPPTAASPRGPLTAAASSASTDMPSFGEEQPLEARLTARGARSLQRARSRRTSLERTPLAPITDLFTGFHWLSWIEKERDIEAVGEPVYTRDGHWEGWKVWFGNLDPRTTEVTMRQWLRRELHWV